DGRSIVTASDAIRVWDLTTGQVLREVGTTSLNATAFTGGEGGLAMSPDGGQLASAISQGSRPRIVGGGFSTRRELRSMNLPDDQIDDVGISFTTDGRLLAAGIVDKKLKVWDVTANLRERTLGPTQKDYGVISFSPDGRLSLSEGYAVNIWDVATGRALPTLNIPNTGLFNAMGVFVGFSSDG